MDSSARYPIRDALFDLTTSTHLDRDISEILQKLGNGGAVGLVSARSPVEEHGPEVADEEGGAMLVAPALV